MPNAVAYVKAFRKQLGYTPEALGRAQLPRGQPLQDDPPARAAARRCPGADVWLTETGGLVRRNNGSTTDIPEGATPRRRGHALPLRPRAAAEPAHQGASTSTTGTPARWTRRGTPGSSRPTGASAPRCTSCGACCVRPAPAGELPRRRARQPHARRLRPLQGRLPPERRAAGDRRGRRARSGDDDGFVWLGLHDPDARGAARGRRALRPAAARGRGRDAGPPAPEDRGLRRRLLPRPAHRALHRRDRGGRVRRGPRLHRARLRRRRAPRRRERAALRARAPRGSSPSCCASARPPPCGPSWTRSSTTTRPSSRGSRTTSRRSRRPSSRAAATRRAASTSCAASWPRFYRAVHPLLTALDVLESRTRGEHPEAAAQPPARRRGPRQARRGGDRDAARRAGEHLPGQPRRHQPAAERRRAQDLRLGGDHRRADVHGQSIWGMNFKHMPELAWRVGYPLALAAMLARAALVLYRALRRAGWL